MKVGWKVKVHSKEVPALLISCPFCGSTDVHLAQYYKGIDKWGASIECRSCGAIVTRPGYKAEQLNDLWDKRPLEQRGIVEQHCDAIRMKKNENRSYMAGWNDALRAVKRSFGWEPMPDAFAPTEEGEANASA